MNKTYAVLLLFCSVLIFGCTSQPTETPASLSASVLRPSTSEDANTLRTFTESSEAQNRTNTFAYQLAQRQLHRLDSLKDFRANTNQDLLNVTDSVFVLAGSRALESSIQDFHAQETALLQRAHMTDNTTQALWSSIILPPSNSTAEQNTTDTWLKRLQSLHTQILQAQSLAQTLCTLQDSRTNCTPE